MIYLNKFLMVVFILVSLIGCASQEVNRASVGKIVNADVVPTSFNESKKMTIKCEKAIIVVLGTPTVLIGEEASIVTYNDGSKYLILESTSEQIRIAR